MTRSQTNSPKPRAWLGIVSVSTMDSVEGYTSADSTEGFDPPTTEVLPVMRGDNSSGKHFKVRLLAPGDPLYCDQAHWRHVLTQVGEAQLQFDPKARNGLIARFTQPVVYLWWNQLGLIFPDPETPPPAHFRLVKLTDEGEFEIQRLMSPSLMRVFRSKRAASRWTRERAQELLTLHLRQSKTA